MAKRYVSSDPTANAAVGATGDNHLAEELRRRARIREARDQAFREAMKKTSSTDEGPVVA